MATDILLEFVADIVAAYGSNGQSDDEIIETLEADWYDLAQTYKKAVAYLARSQSKEIK